MGAPSGAIAVLRPGPCSDPPRRVIGGTLGLGQPQGADGSRQRGNLGRGREGRGRVQMRSRRKRRWMKMKQDLQQEAEEEEAVVGGRKG